MSDVGCETGVRWQILGASGGVSNVICWCKWQKWGRKLGLWAEKGAAVGVGTCRGSSSVSAVTQGADLVRWRSREWRLFSPVFYWLRRVGKAALPRMLKRQEATVGSSELAAVVHCWRQKMNNSCSIRSFFSHFLGLSLSLSEKKKKSTFLLNLLNVQSGCSCCRQLGLFRIHLSQKYLHSEP